MQVIHDAESCPRPDEGTTVTIGFFDGVHLGHRVVIGEVRRLAAELGAGSAVVTFDRHPATIVRPESAPKLLTTLEQRLELLAAAGIDHTVVVHFDEERSLESAEDFVRHELVDCLGARAVVVGADFHFGHGRKGDVALLERMGADHGFEVDGIPLVASGAEGARSVSSTTIRAALASGDLADANRMLGRAHEVRGFVQRGEGRGHDLGFRTADVTVSDELQLPAAGSYAGWFVRPDGTELPAVLTLGRPPASPDPQPFSLLEAHVLDFSGDLYGEEASVRFVARLHGEERVEAVDTLVEQLGEDVARAREILLPLMAAVHRTELPVEGPEPAVGYGTVPVPRLARHVIRLDDGHQVQVAVAGRGVPLVVVHGFTAEGFLYAQTLSRLVACGFKVVAIDTAGHGGTAGLTGGGGGDLAGYAELLGRVIDHLGIKRAVLAGHSMGGRLVTEYAANHPERAIAVLLVDAIVGEAWDRRVAASRLLPPLMVATGVVLLADTATTLPVLRDPRQAVKLGRLWAPVLAHNVRRPWGLIGAGISILRSGPSRWMLERLAEQLVSVFVIHGDKDLAVPLQTASDAARRARGELIVVHGATHAWPLKDPDTMPAIVADLLDDALGEACRVAVTREGLPLDVEDLARVEAVLCEPGALVVDLTPEVRFDHTRVRRGVPRYTWTRSWPR